MKRIISCKVNKRFFYCVSVFFHSIVESLADPVKCNESCLINTKHNETRQQQKTVPTLIKKTDILIEMGAGMGQICQKCFTSSEKVVTLNGK